MTDSNFPPSEILELIRGQARLETKIDQFFSTQTALKSEVDGLKSDISAVKSDISEIKTRSRVTKSYFAGMVAAAGAFGLVLNQILDPILKKFFG